MSVLDNVEGVDAGLHSQNPDTNYECGFLVLGAYINLWGWQNKTDYNCVAVRIDISALPADAVISEGLLYLYVSPQYDDAPRAPSNFYWRIYRCLRAWVSDECTYNIYSTGNSWQSAAALGANDTTGVDGSSELGSDTAGFHWWARDCTALVQDAHADRGDSFDVILLRPAMTLLEGEFSHYKVVACGTEDLRPYLKITYTSETEGTAVLKISGVSWATDVGKLSGVAEVSVSKASGISAN